MPLKVTLKESEVTVPFVSIVMPAYNADRFIGSSIESVLKQSFVEWELIVIDDCSTDATAARVLEYARNDPRIELISLEKNFGGPAGPRNVGVKKARAELVAFLDSDDIWHPDKLAKQVEIIRGKGASFVCSEMVDFENEQEISFPGISEFGLENVSFVRQALRARIPTSSVVVNKALLLQNPFREDPRYKAVEDYHCWLRILRTSGGCTKLKIPLLHYRRSEGQISGSKVKMMKRVFMVHREYTVGSSILAGLLTGTHVVGGVYFRFFKKGM